MPIFSPGPDLRVWHTIFAPLLDLGKSFYLSAAKVSCFETHLHHHNRSDQSLACGDHHYPVVLDTEHGIVET
jgi:hypothetical protein